MAVGLKVRGLTELTAKLKGMKERLADLSPVTKVIAQDLDLLIKDSFDRQQAPNGSPWQPLEASTIRRRRGTVIQILRDTSRLYNSTFAIGHEKGVTFGAAVVYAMRHQFGFTNLPWWTPARPYLPVDSVGGGQVRWMDGGPAKTFREAALAALSRYVREG